MKEIIEFNETQLKHMRIVQMLVHDFCDNLMTDAIQHDKSKFSEKEYETFVGSTESLKQSKTGMDENYQRNLNTEAIQHHITTNPHHPEAHEFGKMPFSDIIAMFFDWEARSIQKGTAMEDFWEYNLAKLEKYQPQAIQVVELMKEESDISFSKMIIDVKETRNDRVLRMEV